MCLGLWVLAVGDEARAITLDEFLGDGTATSSSSGVGVSATTANVGAVGGVRTLFAIKNTFGAGVTRLETFPDPEFSGDTDYSLGYTQGAHNGLGVVSWDGDGNAATLTPNGLPSIDLLQDAGTAILLGAKFFDFPASQPIDLTIRLYDAANGAGQKFSDLTITLDQSINSLTAVPLTIPFSRFTNSGTDTIPAPGGTFATKTAFGPAGAVDLSKIGAVQLTLNGLTNSNAPDIVLDFLSTNGRCTSVPNAQGRVIDGCGVCLESQNAGKGKDSCGVCLFGPPGYSYVPVIDECGLCPSATNYGKAKDPCGVCFGDGSSCADCSGTPNGTTKVDQCGVCGGNGSSCLDCAGVPFGTAALDLCGVCKGDGSTCKDCAGITLGGAKVDACGVCGGSITDTTQCPTTTNCVTVAATEEVLNFEKRLLDQAQLIFTRFKDESKRSSKNRCGINTLPATKKVTRAYNQIRSEGKSIFTKGVQVCSDSCVTVSYAEQVTKLSPEFKMMEKETVALANKVKSCFKRKRIVSKTTKRGVAQTVVTVKTGLAQLVQDCKNSKVCPPK